MATLGQAFNASKYSDMQSFEPVPAGDYISQVTKSDINLTKKKDGKKIELEFTILKGEFKGKKFFQNLNIVNPSVTAVEIAQKELATICRAIGKPNGILDTKELHAIPMVVTLKIEIDKKGVYSPKNAPTAYVALGSTGMSTSPGGTGEPDFTNDDPISQETEKGIDQGNDQETMVHDKDDSPWG